MHCWWEMQIGVAAMEYSMEVPQNGKELPHDPAFPHLTIHWKKKLFQKVICRILWVVQCLRLGAIADWICVQFLVREGLHAVWYREKSSMYPNVESGILKINNTRYGHKFTADELINMSWYIQVEYCSQLFKRI